MTVMRNIARGRHVMLAAVSAVALLAGGAASAQQSAAPIDLPAQPLQQALTAIGQHYDLSVVASADLVRGLAAPAVSGALTPDQALEQLLDGTGLEARRSSSGAIMIVRRSDPAPAAAPAAPAPAQADEARGAPDIVLVTGEAVTATKTATPIMQTPQSISIIPATQFVEQGAGFLQETLRYSGGVRPEPNGTDYRFDYTTARGGFSLGEYQDGIQRPSGFYAPRVELFTLERVELLRGPSSVLYGQGSPGGLLNAVTKLPGFEAGGEVGLEYGSYDRKQAQFDYTGPLGGALAGRFVAVVRDAGNQIDYGRDDRLLLMPSLRWSPDERTDVSLIALYQNDKARSISQFLPSQATLDAPPGRRMRDDTFLGEPDNNRFDKEQASVTLLASHKANDWLELRSNTRYLEAEQQDEQIYPNVYSGEENPFLDADRRLLSRSLFNTFYDFAKIATDNSVVAAFGTGALEHRLLAGVDYQRDEVTGGYADTTVAPIDIYDPVYSGVPQNLTYLPIPEQVTSQLGVYAQDQIRYRDRATLMLGVRRDHAKTETVGSPAQEDNVTSFRAGLIVDATENLAPYVNYSESFQPVVGVNVAGQPFLPERGVQYEAGVKWSPAAGSLVTLAAFDIRGQNRLVNDPADPNNLLQIGEVHAQGLELEATLALPGAIELSGAYSYVDAEVSGSSEPLEIGLPIIGVPEHIASLWISRTWALGDGLDLRVGGGARYTGSTEQAIAAPPDVLRQETPDYTVVDAFASLEKARWSLSVSATNVFDKRYYALCGYRADCAVGLRRNVVASLRYAF